MELHKRKSEYHVISQHKVCCICKKPLLVSVFWSYPNRDLVHHACRERYEKEQKNINRNSRSASKLLEKKSDKSLRYSEDLFDACFEETPVKSAADLSFQLKPLHQDSNEPEGKVSKEEVPISANSLEVEEQVLTNPFQEVELDMNEIPRNPFMAPSEERSSQRDNFNNIKGRERRGGDPLNPFQAVTQNPFVIRMEPAKNPFRATENSTSPTNPFMKNDNPFNEPLPSNPASALTRIDDFSSFL